METLAVSRAASWVRSTRQIETGWSRGGRIAAAVAVTAGGFFQAVADVLEPAYDDQTERFTAMADGSVRFELAGAFGIVAVPFLLVMVLVLLALARQRSPRLAWTGATMAFAGFVALAVLHGIEMTEVAALQDGLGVAAVHRVDDAIFGSVTVVPLIVMFLSAPIGLVLMVVALWRAATVPRLPLLLIVLFLAADFGLFGTVPFPLHLIWLVALSWIAGSLVRGAGGTRTADTR